MKNVKLNLALILIAGVWILGISSCDNKKNCCTLIDVDVQISYKNQSGENLINSDPDFEESNIKVYYKNGNEFEYVFNGILDSPNMHRISEDSNGNLILTVYASNYYEGNQSTTLIALNPNVVDTLFCEFELEGSNQICKRAWLNGEEMENRFIEIEK